MGPHRLVQPAGAEGPSTSRRRSPDCRLEDGSAWVGLHGPSTDGRSPTCSRSSASSAESRGAPSLPDGELVHESPWLNLYLYPRELDYPRSRPALPRPGTTLSRASARPTPPGPIPSPLAGGRRGAHLRQPRLPRLRRRAVDATARGDARAGRHTATSSPRDPSTKATSSRTTCRARSSSRRRGSCSQRSTW